jgi:4a-hydroxytetrahydrobiopterin dehydratase
MEEKLTKEDLERHLAGLNNWEFKENAIEKSYTFPTFDVAFGFICRVALLSERFQHHPDWSGVYNKVKIKLSTHDADGVTLKDIDMAKEIDKISV